MLSDPPATSDKLATVRPADASVSQIPRKADAETVRELMGLWPTISDRVRAFARRRSRSDHKADDLVQEALRSIFDGSRRWDRAATPDLYTFVCGVVRSLSSHEARDGAKRPIETSFSSGAEPPSSSPNPEQLLDAKQDATARAAHAQEIIARLRGAFTGDTLALSILDLRERDVQSPKEQSLALGVSPTLLRSAQKRIDYALARITEPMRKSA
jgi:DNA-directed RNA polymerase specialized sigma24 family protein